MNGAHAGWSLGSVFGGGLGALTAYLHMSFSQAVVGMAALGLPVALALLPTYVADTPAPVPTRTARIRIPRVIYLVGAVTCASFIVEGSVADWGGLYLRNELGAREAVAALAYPCFEAAMFVGRFRGDGVRRRVGSRTMLTAAGLGTVVGFAVVVAAPHWWLALVGFSIAGLSICTVGPLTLSIAGALDRTGAAIAQAGAMGYGGMLIGPVGIGYLANVTSLRTGLLLPLGLGMVISVLSGIASTLNMTMARATAANTGEVT